MSRLVDGALVVVGVLLHLVGAWFVLAAGLVAPPWAIVVLGVVWVGAWVPLVRGVRVRARWVPLVPIGFALFWFALLNLGEITFGWTA